MSDNMNDKIFEFAYELALRDATMMKAYPVKDKNQYLRKTEVAEKAKQHLKDYVDKIIESELTEAEHEDMFNNLSKELANVFTVNNCTKAFTFGNIQKLINMTVKYMYIATYNNKELRKNFKCCHCPLDRKMRDVIWSKIKDKEIDGCEKEINYLREKGFKNCVWSKLENPDGFYKAFQTIVRHIEKDGNPIEFDYKNWSPSEEKKEDKQ